MQRGTHMYVSIYVYIHIYIYIHIYRYIFFLYIRSTRSTWRSTPKRSESRASMEHATVHPSGKSWKGMRSSNARSTYAAFEGKPTYAVWQKASGSAKRKHVRKPLLEAAGPSRLGRPPRCVRRSIACGRLRWRQMMRSESVTRADLSYIPTCCESRLEQKVLGAERRDERIGRI